MVANATAATASMCLGQSGNIWEWGRVSGRKKMPSDFARNDSSLQLWISFHSDFEQKNIQFFF